MVATLAKAATADYYIHSQASFRPPGEYYLSGEEPDGVWWNPSSLLPDDDDPIEHGQPIDSAHFYRLYRGFHPRTGEKLARTAGAEKRCPAFDLVFNADKTVSALWAIAPPDLRAELEKAHNDAVKIALDETIKPYCSHTRVGHPDGGVRVVPADIMAALFQHGASRSNDPHLHTHCVIFNLVRTHLDGKWRTLHGRPLYSWPKAAGATYRAELAHLLRERLGIDMEVHGDEGEYTRIPDTPESLLKDWSKRDIQITDTAARFGVGLKGNHALHGAIQKMTRASKQHGVDPDTRHLAWTLDASEHIEDIPAYIESITGNELEFTDEQKLEIAKRVAAVPAELTKFRSVFQYTDLVEKTANAAGGLLNREQRKAMVDELLKNQDVVELDKPDTSYDAGSVLQHGRTFTAAHTIQTEANIHDLATRLDATRRFGIAEDTTRAKIEELIATDYPISDEQIAAMHAATKPGQIAIIEGAAGSGKTTTLWPIADLYRETGHEIIATSVSWRTTLELGTDLEAPNWCVEALTARIATGSVYAGPRTVIVVDEAGQLSSLQALHILRIAESTGAKIILAGDTQQQQPVEAGPGLRLIREVVGTTRVDTIRRQKHDLEDMLLALRDVSRDYARLAAEAATPDERAVIGQAFDALPDERKSAIKPWQVQASEDFKDGEAARAIAAYRDRGRIHIDANLDATLTRLIDDWRRVRTEQPDKTTAVIAYSKAEVRALSFLMRQRVLENYDGPRYTVQACRSREPRAKPEALEIAIGDTIRIGAAHFGKRIFNGTHLEVLDLREDPPSIVAPDVPRLWIRGRTDRGRIVEFHHDQITDWFGKIRLDHGYAMTMNAAQGLTVDRAFVFANQKPSRETIYPAATRHRERMDLYVDRAPVELDVRYRRTEDLATEPVTDADILAYLAQNWSRSRPEEAAQDYMSDRMKARLIHRDTSDAAAVPAAPSQTPSDVPNAARSPDSHHVSADRWLAANDAGDGRLAEVASLIRYSEIELRHRLSARTIGDACRKLNASLAQWDEARKTDGNAAVASNPQFRNDLREATAILKTAAPFLKRDTLHARVLREHGGIEISDLQTLAAARRRARSIGRMSLEERRELHPLFTSSNQTSTPELAAADSIETAIDALQPPAPQARADRILEPELDAPDPAHLDADRDIGEFPDLLEHDHPSGYPDARAFDASAGPPDDFWEGFDQLPEQPDIHPDYDDLHPHYEPEPDAIPHHASHQVPAEPDRPHASTAPEVPDRTHAPEPAQAAEPAPHPRVEAFIRRWDAHCTAASDAGVHPFADPAWPAIHREMLDLSRLPGIPEADRANLLRGIEMSDAWLQRHAPELTHQPDPTAGVQPPEPAPAPDLHPSTPQPETPRAAAQRLYEDHLDRRNALMADFLGGRRNLIAEMFDPSLQPSSGAPGWDQLRDEARELLDNPHLPDAARKDLAIFRQPVPAPQTAHRSKAGREFIAELQKHDAAARGSGLHPLDAPGFPRLAAKARGLIERGSVTETEAASLRKLLDRYDKWAADSQKPQTQDRTQDIAQERSRPRGMSF